MTEWKTEIERRLATLNLEATRETEIIEELVQHLEDRFRELLASGLSRDQARQQALGELSDGGQLERELRSLEPPAESEPPVLGERRINMIEDICRDVRYGYRALANSRGFTAVAVLTLALGIGINTSLFSLFNAVLLRPLPFKDAERIALLWESKPAQGDDQIPFSMPNFNDMRAQASVFQTMAVFSVGRFNLASEDQPEGVQSAMVSSSFFDVFGVKPVEGRLFVPSEDEPGVERIAVISNSLWRRKFNADPGLVGRTISLDGQSYEVVGVLPPDFNLISSPKPTEVWTPFGLDTFRDRRVARDVHALPVVAKLKGGVTESQAQTEMDAIAARLEKEYPGSNTGRRIRVVPLREQAVRNLRPALLALLAAVTFVLLIACANVANLLTARASARRREMAIRAALGASRGRLVRQLLTESLLLSLTGGALGVLIAFWGSSALSVLPYQPYQLYTVYAIGSEQVGVDRLVLGYAFGLSVVTGLIFGLLPAFSGSRIEVNEMLKEGGGFSRGGRAWGRALLVGSEVALSMILLIGAGLMIRSFAGLIRVNPGFHPENVVTIDLNLSRAKYRAADKALVFYDQLLGRLKALPGVQAAGGTEFLPLTGAESSGSILVEGRQFGPSDDPRAVYSSVAGDYFSAMGIPFEKGRSFGDEDGADSRRVAIINEAMARRYWPGEDPIGKHVALVFESLRFFPNRPPEVDMSLGAREVVGVATDVRHSRLEDAAGPAIYLPLSQRPATDLTLVLRTSTGAAGIVEAVRRTVLELDKDQPIASARTMSEVVDRTVAPKRFSTWMIALFSSLALALAAIGLYGVIAYDVSRRTRELGVRMALGASPADVLRLVLTNGLKVTIGGIAAGVGGALALTRLIASLLFKVEPADPLTFGAVALLVLSVAMLACYLPARRASRVDPMSALRCE